MMKIGNTIADARKRKGMTQEELADSIQVTRQSISKWENDESMPDIENIYKLCEVLNLTVEDFKEMPKRKFQMRFDSAWIYAMICVIIGVITGYVLAVSLLPEQFPDDFIERQKFDFVEDYYTIVTITTNVDMSDYTVSCVYEDVETGKKDEVNALVDEYQIKCGYRTEYNKEKDIYLKLMRNNSERILYRGSFIAEGEHIMTYFSNRY